MLMQEPTVFIVDDDPDMRDSLRWLMETVGLRAACFESAVEFLRDFDGNATGCLVVDVRMPGMSGLELLETLATGGECVPVIFITAHADVPMAIRALKSGAAEFIEKPFNRQSLLDKVQWAIREDAAPSARCLPTARRLEARFRRLTDKEREALELIKQGLPNKAIATHLDITPRAVEMRRSGLMKKLGARSLAELLRLAFALRGGSLTPPVNGG